MKRSLVLGALILLWGVSASQTLAQSPNYAGSFEVADCNVISGWIEDANQTGRPVNVNIFSGTTLAVTGLANLQRNDVGAHGFNIPTPNVLKDGQVHTLRARGDGSNNDILNSPRQMGPCTGRDNVGVGVVLNVDFKLNNGAASTTNRVVALDFTASESSNTTQDVTDSITAYRVKESPNLNDVSLSGEPWIPNRVSVSKFGRALELALRNGNGQRYGERKVMFQVKKGNLESRVTSDTINLDPVLKEYRVSAQGNTHPLIQFAASQGFEFKNSLCHECEAKSGAKCSGDISSGQASITCGMHQLSAAEIDCLNKASDSRNPLQDCHITPRFGCDTRTEYELFTGRDLNDLWKIKSVTIPGAAVTFHGPNRFLVKFTGTQSLASPAPTCPLGTVYNEAGACAPIPSPLTITVGDIVVEGPEADDFVDPANPWKNAFVRPSGITRPVFQPGVPRPTN